MNPFQKIGLIRSISKRLDDTMSMQVAETFLEMYGINSVSWEGSQYEYVIHLLGNKDDRLLLRIGTDMGLPTPEPADPTIDSTHWKPGLFRVFISHITAHKDKATKLSQALAQFGCTCFVSHENIRVSKQWREEIRLALRTMDAFICVLTEGFHESQWTDQEVGIALGQNSLVIPLIHDVNAYGFLEALQGKKTKAKSLADVAWAVIETLASEPQTAKAYAAVIASLMLQAKTPEELKRWADVATRLNHFDLTTLEGVKKRFESFDRDNLPSIEIVTVMNDLLVSKGFKPISLPKPRAADFDDEIPF